MSIRPKNPHLKGYREHYDDFEQAVTATLLSVAEWLQTGKAFTTPLLGAEMQAGEVREVIENIRLQIAAQLRREAKA